MKLQKDDTKEPFPFLMNYTTLTSDYPLKFRKPKMSVSEKTKTIDQKIKQNKAQYNLDRNVNGYDFLTSEDVLPNKELLEKAPTFKRFKYSPLDSELKKGNNY